MKKPTNLQECLDSLKVSYEQGGWEEFKNMSEDEAIPSCHHTTGRAMRNEWNLWDPGSELHKWFIEKSVWHADDMSNIILRSFHRIINGKDIDLEGQISFFKSYWEKNSNLEDEAIFEISHKSSPSQDENKKGLPPICRETMSMDINGQIRVVLFPEIKGQPAIDVIQLDLTQIKGKTTSIYMTPCEAMEIAGGLNSAVQFYLYNQEQYRKEVLEPRLEISEGRKK